MRGTEAKNKKISINGLDKIPLGSFHASDGQTDHKETSLVGLVKWSKRRPKVCPPTKFKGHGELLFEFMRNQTRNRRTSVEMHRIQLNSQERTRTHRKPFESTRPHIEPAAKD